MNAPDIYAKPRKAWDDRMAYRAVTFRAWTGNREIINPALQEAATWKEAEDAAAPDTAHKAFVSILRTDPHMQLVRFYTVKKSATKGEWRSAYDGGRKVFEGRLELKEVGELLVDAFEPKRPFDALKDDATGVDRTLIEGKVL